QWNVGPGMSVAVIGMGGLGHVGVQLAVAMGAEVTVLSQTTSKRDDSLRFGAVEHYATAGDEGRETLRGLRGTFDVILNTVSANLPVDRFLATLKPRGALVGIGIPTEPMSVRAGSLAAGRKILTGSMIGGIPETQEMLEFCARHGVTAEIEMIAADKINEAYDRVVNSDVRYRFVIDAKAFCRLTGVLPPRVARRSHGPPPRGIGAPAPRSPPGRRAAPNSAPHTPPPLRTPDPAPALSPIRPGAPLRH